MPTRVYYYSEALTRTTSTTTDFSVVKVTLPFLPNANKTYALIWCAILDGNVDAAHYKVRLRNTTAAVTLAEEEAFVRTTTVATSNLAAGGVALYTAGASPIQQTIEIQTASDTSALTTGTQEARLLILELIDNVDVWASSAGQSNTTSTTYASKVTLPSWTPASAGDYLTIVYGEVAPNAGSVGEEVKAQLLTDGATVRSKTPNFDYDAGTQWFPCSFAYKHVGITGAHTAALQYGAVTTGLQVSIRNAFAISLRLDRFDSAFVAESRSQLTSTSATYATHVTTGAQTPAAVPYAIIALGIADIDSGPGWATATANRIAVNGTAQGTVFSHARGAIDYYWHWFQVLRRTEAVTSTTWTTEYARSAGAVGARSDENVLAVLQLESTFTPIGINPMLTHLAL